jgi:hypothetical protein
MNGHIQNPLSLTGNVMELVEGLNRIFVEIYKGTLFAA